MTQSSIQLELEAATTLLLEIQQEYIAALRVLEFYADPTTYLAWSFFSDPPCGDFGSDFSYTTVLGNKPGRRAREFLEGLAAKGGGDELADGEGDCAAIRTEPEEATAINNGAGTPREWPA